MATILAGFVRVQGLEGIKGMVQETTEVPATFHAFEPALPPPTLAVDGSHAVLVDNGAYWVVAVRAAHSDALAETMVFGTRAADAEADVQRSYAERGLGAPPVRSADAFAEAHRALAELDAATEATRVLPEGGLLLIDGALAQLPDAPQAIADRVLDRAMASGVHLAGISKRSGLSHDGVPMLPALARQGPPSCWWSPLPGHTAIATRLHPAARHVFRVDAETSVLPWLAHWSRDAVYRGYPYPLAKAHNGVAITRVEARRLAEHVRNFVGPDASAFDDFHAVLDRNAPRGT